MQAKLTYVSAFLFLPDGFQKYSVRSSFVLRHYVYERKKYIFVLRNSALFFTKISLYNIFITYITFTLEKALDCEELL